MAPISLSILQVNAFGRPAVFAGFAVVCWLGALWLYVALPETANKSLEEIADLFRRPGDDDVYTPAVSNHGCGNGNTSNSGNDAGKWADCTSEEVVVSPGAGDREGAEPLISDLARSLSSSPSSRSSLHDHAANPRAFV